MQIIDSINYGRCCDSGQFVLTDGNTLRRVALCNSHDFVELKTLYIVIMTALKQNM